MFQVKQLDDGADTEADDVELESSSEEDEEEETSSDEDSPNKLNMQTQVLRAAPTAPSAAAVKPGLSVDNWMSSGETGNLQPGGGNPVKIAGVQRKVASLVSRSPVKTVQNSTRVNSNDMTDSLANLQRVIHFSDTESEHSDAESEAEEKSHDQHNIQLTNGNVPLKDVYLNGKDHDTERQVLNNDRNNNMDSNQCKIFENDNENRNARTSTTTVSESSHSSNVLEANSHSSRGPTPLSQRLGSESSEPQNPDSHSEQSSHTVTGANTVKPSDAYNSNDGRYQMDFFNTKMEKITAFECKFSDRCCVHVTIHGIDKLNWGCFPGLLFYWLWKV